MLRSIKPHEINQGTVCTVLGLLVTSSVIPCQNNLCVTTHDAILLKLIWILRLRQHTYHAAPQFEFPSHSCTSRLPLFPPSSWFVISFLPPHREFKWGKDLWFLFSLSLASNPFAVRNTDLQHVAWSHGDDYYTDPSKFEANTKLESRNTFWALLCQQKSLEPVRHF
jgi:hypothetical protein